MTPLVMDTGVLVAGLYWHNEPHQCLRAWQRGVFHLAVSDADAFAKIAELAKGAAA